MGAQNISATLQAILPDWPAPKHIKAYTTTRMGGYSKFPYDSFNLGMHVEDNPIHVAANRNLLMTHFNIPTEPLWIKQVHGIDIAGFSHPKPLTADASVAFEPNQVCVVLTADCLPVLICDKKGTRVSAIHAGWKGLAAGIIEAAVHTLQVDPKELLVWLGPAIGPNAFEVGVDVLQSFHIDLEKKSGFRPIAAGKFLGDLYYLARLRLNRLGIGNNAIYGGNHCTFKEETRFYSYRRDKITGRMASLIWIDNTV